MSATKSSASTAVAVAGPVFSNDRCTGRDVAAATTTAGRILAPSASTWPTSAPTRRMPWHMGSPATLTSA
jgi:hypothetical protein